MAKIVRQYYSDPKDHIALLRTVVASLLHAALQDFRSFYFLNMLYILNGTTTLSLYIELFVRPLESSTAI